MKTLGKIIVWLCQLMTFVYWVYGVITLSKIESDWICEMLDKISQKRLEKKTDKNDGWRFDID